MRLERTSPESQGVFSQDVLAFLHKIKEENQELHSFMLLKNGKVISECWWKPYAPQYRHQMFSLTKSFTSIAIGIAVDEGLLTVDTFVTDILKEEIEALEEHADTKINKMTVKHLLTMSTGMTYQNWQWDGNHTKGFLSAHIKDEPGSTFCYSSLASHMLSVIITKLTGYKLCDYLQPRLFEPLGIHTVWDEDAKGFTMGGFGLALHTEDIAVFGQFLLQKGMYNGKQLVSKEWINEATHKQISNGEQLDSDHAQGYGYQFWQCKPNGIYRGDGMYGQFCIVMPEQNAVLVTTSCVDIQRTLDLVWEHLLPALKGKQTHAENDYERNALLNYTAGLTYLLPSETEEQYPNIHAAYTLKDKASAINLREQTAVIKFQMEHNECIMTMHTAMDENAAFAYYFRMGKWEHGAAPFYMYKKATKDNNFSPFYMDSHTYNRLYTYGEWQKNTFTATLWYYETPPKIKIICNFSEDGTELSVTYNIPQEEEKTLIYTLCK